MSNAYKNQCIIMPTKHAKSIAIMQPFWKILSANIMEYYVDTDMLGTFSGEVEREGNALECARRKCEWTLELLGDKLEYCIASEGSFGPHPHIPFLPCDQEILYFIDRKRDFHLHMTHLTEKTNYQMKEVESFDELLHFADAAKFPSHALIIRPDNQKNSGPLFKGIDTPSKLEEAFEKALKASSSGKVWVETDMRAQFNPSRMAAIGVLADKLAYRLSTECTKCLAPGWGKVRVEIGLECSMCSSETEMVKYEIFGCTKCDYEEKIQRSDGLTQAEPSHCQYCNP